MAIAARRRPLLETILAMFDLETHIFLLSLPRCRSTYLPTYGTVAVKLEIGAASQVQVRGMADQV